MPLKSRAGSDGLSFTEPLPQVNEDEQYLEEDQLSSYRGIGRMTQILKIALIRGHEISILQDAFTNANGGDLRGEGGLTLTGAARKGKFWRGWWASSAVTALPASAPPCESRGGQIVSVNLKDLTSDKQIGGKVSKPRGSTQGDQKKLLTQELEQLTKLRISRSSWAFACTPRTSSSLRWC